jgi:hypothetical protein
MDRYAWLLLYIAVYVSPMALIVAAFVATLGRRKLSEREGRLLRVLSGAMMLGLGCVLLLAPETLTNPLTALALIAVALGVCGTVARMDRGATADPPH